MTQNIHDEVAAILDVVHKHVANGRFVIAEACYRNLQAISPGHPEAVNFLAACEIAKGNRDAGISMLERSLLVYPHEPLTLKNLGTLYSDCGRLKEAEQLLIASLRLAPDYLDARLEFARVLESTNRIRDAARVYFGAIRCAQAQGKWMNDVTTHPDLRADVIHAVSVVNTYRRELTQQILAPLIGTYGLSSMLRVREAIAGYIGDMQPTYSDVRQRPKFLYFPNLPTTPFLPIQHCQWIAELESATAMIRSELADALIVPDRIEPFLRFNQAADQSKYLQSDIGLPQWDAFFFYRHGKPSPENLNLCPATSAALKSIPLPSIEAHSPEACFSILSAGTRIMPHFGVTNTRVVVHLPLIVPAGCSLVVGGESHEWVEGRCVVFDDTFEHEAWNRGDEQRAVLISDVWNPYLTIEERRAISEFVAEIGKFNEDYRF